MQGDISAAPKRKGQKQFDGAQVAELHQLFRSSPWSDDVDIRAFLGSHESTFGQVSAELAVRVKRWLSQAKIKYKTKANGGTTLTKNAWNSMSDQAKDVVCGVKTSDDKNTAILLSAKMMILKRTVHGQS